VSVLREPVRLDRKTLVIAALVAVLTLMACLAMYRAANPPAKTTPDNSKFCLSAYQTFVNDYEFDHNGQEPDPLVSGQYAQQIGCKGYF
jgi:hypothetical protein